MERRAIYADKWYSYANKPVFLWVLDVWGEIKHSTYTVLKF